MAKLNVLLFSLVFCALASIQCFSQSSFSDVDKNKISEVKKKMDDAELTKMTDAENAFEEAKFVMENVQTEDEELEKAFAKGSTPKAEKKAVNVKRNRIVAAKLNEKAYNLIFEACDGRLGKMKFGDKDAQVKAKDIRNKASEKITAATTKGDDYKYLEDADLETRKYDEIKTSIDEAYALFAEAITLELAAWDLHFNQLSVAPSAENQAKPVETQTEPVATVQPTSEPAVEDAILVEKPIEPAPAPEPKPEPVPVVETPKPAPVAEAPKPAPAPEKPKAQVKAEKTAPVATAPSKAREQKSLGAGAIYRVQLAAIQRGQLPTSIKQELYSGTKTLSEEFENGMYKYRVGDFNSFSEAKQFMEEYGKGSFIVKYVNGVKQ